MSAPVSQQYFDKIATAESYPLTSFALNDPKRYYTQNDYNMLGKYQMSTGALVQAGLYSGSVDPTVQHWDDTQWTDKARELGVNSSADFLANGAAQEAAVRAYTDKQWNALNANGSTQHIGETVNGTEITATGLLAGAHLKGPTGVLRYLENGINGVDANQTPVSKYIGFGPEIDAATPWYDKAIIQAESWFTDIGAGVSNAWNASASWVQNQLGLGPEPYTVQRGDNLSAIAARYGVTLDQLLEANPQYRANPGRIGIGDTVTIPSGSAPTTTTANNSAIPAVSGAPIPTLVTLPDGRHVSAYLTDGKVTSLTDELTGKTYVISPDGSVREAGYAANYNGEITPISHTTADTPAVSEGTNPAATAAAGGVLSALSFLQSLQAGNELGAVTSAISMLNSFAQAEHLAKFGSLDGFSAPVNITATSSLGALGALIGLSNALREGDTFGAIVQGANLAYQSATLYSALSTSTVASQTAVGGTVTQTAGTGAAASDAGSALGSFGTVVGILGIAYSLEQGDVYGAMASALMTAAAQSGNYYLAIAAVVVMVIGMFDEEDPPPAPRIWGEGTLIWDEAGGVSVAVRGGDHTNDKAYKKQRDEFAEHGQAPIRNLLGNIETALEAYIQNNPGMGVIPTRLPILHYEQAQNALTLTIINAQTGDTTIRRFDPQTGYPLDVAEGPDVLKTFFDVYIEMAEDNLAIAPDFEVAAAKEAYREALSHPQPVNITQGGSGFNADTGAEEALPDIITLRRFIPQAGEADDEKAESRLLDGSILSRTLSGELVLATRSSWFTDETDAESNAPPSSPTLLPVGEGSEARTTGNALNALVLQTAWTESLAESDSAPTVVFNVGEGYTQTTRLKGDQDVIVVDLNNDGNLQTREVVRSLNQLAAYDANHDSKIDASDPIYGALKLWSETQHDPNAASLLAPRIESIDLASGDVTFIAETGSAGATPYANASTAKQTLELTDPKRYTALTGAIFEETLTKSGKQDTVHIVGVLRADSAADATTIRIGMNDARLMSASQALAREREALARSSNTLFTDAGSLLTAAALGVTAADAAQAHALSDVPLPESDGQGNDARFDAFASTNIIPTDTNLNDHTSAVEQGTLSSTPSTTDDPCATSATAASATPTAELPWPDSDCPTPVINNPDVEGEILTVGEDATLLIDAQALLANDLGRNDAGFLRVTGVSGASHGSVSLSHDGTIEFIPEADYYGLASFAYTVSDGVGGIAASSVELRLTPNVHNTRIVETLENTETRIALLTLLDGAIDRYQGALTLTEVSIDSDSHVLGIRIDDKTTDDIRDDEVVFTPQVGYYNRLYNPALGRFQDLTNDPNASGLDPYSGPLRNETYRDRELAHFRYTVEDEWGNAVSGSTSVGINYHELPQTSTPINVHVGDVYGYEQNVYDIDGNFTGVERIPGRPTPMGADGKLVTDSPYPESAISYSALVYSGNPAGAVGLASDGTWSFQHYNPWSGGNPRAVRAGETEWLLWATDPAGNTSDRRAMLWGGFGDDGYLWDDTQSNVINLPHGGVLGGAFGQTTIANTGTHGQVGGQLNIEHAAPIVLDLDGNGATLVDLSISAAYFDMKGDGLPRHTGWVDKGDGLLAFDYNHDGKITDAQEIEFTRHKEGVTTDLEGLSAFDTNHNGKLDADDQDWSRFGVWQDKNGNGKSEAGEFQSLDARGMASIELTPQGEPSREGQNIINATSTYTRTDGTTGQAADVALAYETAPPIQIVRTEPATLPPDTWEAQIARMALVFTETMAQASANEAAPLWFVESSTNDLSAIIPPSEDHTGMGST